MNAINVTLALSVGFIFLVFMIYLKPKAEELREELQRDVPINTYDIDGVIFLGAHKGLTPLPEDIIITGRSVEERPETERMLADKGIYNEVFFNPRKFDDKSRTTSGIHKADTLIDLIGQGYKIDCHFEDDPIQAEVIKHRCPTVNVILLTHDLVEKENVRHVYP